VKDSVKLGAAVVGGYLLGRTKKGKAAIGLALWLSGKRMDNSRDALMRLATSPELAKLTAQVRGPLLAAAGRAVTATIESRTTALADSLQQRTSQLLPASGSGADERVDDAGREDRADSRSRSGKARKAKRDDVPDEADAMQDRVDPMEDEVDDGGDYEDQEEPEPPREAKRAAKAARRTPAGRSADESREPARSREPGRSREAGRSRESGRRPSADRDGA
jgi:hypothetical protein